MHFDRKSEVDRQLEPVILPKLQGMSGGPIWQLDSSNEDDFRFGFRLSALLLPTRNVIHLFRAPILQLPCI